MSPFMVAGLFYLGSGLGVGIILRRLRSPGTQHEHHGISRAELPWLFGAIAAGG